MRRNESLFEACNRDGLRRRVPISVSRQESIRSNDKGWGILLTRSVSRHCHIVVSQSLTVPSYEAEARRVPSPEVATELAELLWPSSVARH